MSTSIETIRPIIDDEAIAGSIATALEVVRWCLKNPEWRCGHKIMPAVAHCAVDIATNAIRGAVEHGGDCNLTQCHADAIASRLGIAGLQQRISALDHLYRRDDPHAVELATAIELEVEQARRLIWRSLMVAH